MEREAAWRLSHGAQSELPRFVVSVQERLHLRHFVTGSTVTIFYEEPRFTNDIDIVVDLPVSAAREFRLQFREEDLAALGPSHSTPLEDFGEGGPGAALAFGLTQKAIARRLGVDPTTVRSWEKGKSRPTAKSVRRLEEFFE